MRYRLLIVGLILLVPTWAVAQPADDTSLDEELPPPPTPGIVEEPEPERPATEFGIGEEFQLEARDRVISAARTETTIQEVPAIVTVITRDEIRARGFRTVLEVLESVPGFEANRSDGNHWTIETFARGNPRTILYLINGINVVEPLRNQITLDRKLPLDIVERIEIISGPGGVLWGSNALLGVVNITTVNARDHEGWSIRGGGGGGPGELQAAEANASWGGELFEDLHLYANFNFFTSRGSEVTPDYQKVVGVLPEPDPDGITLFIPESATTDNGRDFYGSLYLDLRGGPLTFNAFFQFEQDRRPQAFGGAVLTTDVRTPPPDGQLDPPRGSYDLENVGGDALWWVHLNYRDRFADDDFGISTTAYFVSWQVDEDPFGTFPPSDLLPRGLATTFTSDGEYRTGLNVDADYILPADNHLIFGGEVFADLVDDVRQEFPEDPTDPDPDRVTFTDILVFGEQRVIGALYLSDEWRPADEVALNAGARLQLSNTYDPTVLLAGALVWNLFGQTYTKLNFAQGFRPPDLQSTNTNGDIRSGITFQGNPNLDVERSSAAEVELNSVIVDGGDVVDRWFLRADYSFTWMEDIIRNASGTFINSGTRFIHSAEFLTRITFVGNHELSAGYYFVTAEDDELGPLRNIPNHQIYGHLRLQIIPDIFHFSTDLTFLGAREDLNRRVPEADSPGEIVSVFPTDVFVQTIPSTTLWRAGLVAENLWDMLRLTVFGYNMLNDVWLNPDYFFDDRVATIPYYNPGWSIWTTAEVEW